MTHVCVVQQNSLKHLNSMNYHCVNKFQSKTSTTEIVINTKVSHPAINRVKRIQQESGLQAVRDYWSPVCSSGPTHPSPGVYPDRSTMNSSDEVGHSPNASRAPFQPRLCRRRVPIELESLDQQQLGSRDSDRDIPLVSNPVQYTSPHTPGYLPKIMQLTLKDKVKSLL